MTSYDDTFDLSQIFIAREQQLDLFEIYLDRWKKLLSNTPPKDTHINSAPSANNKIQGLVVLLYGGGGYGKSTLLWRYRDIALKGNQNALTGKVQVSNVLDWGETVDADKYRLFNPPQNQAVDALEYFRVLCGQLGEKLGKNPKDFKEYAATARDVEEARTVASNAFDDMKKEDRFASLRSLTIEALAAAISAALPGSGVLLGNPTVKAAEDEVAKLAQAQIVQAWERLRHKLGSKSDDFLTPALRLGLALGHDLARFAKDFPLLLFFDTYEKADEADNLLRIVMGAAGLRVGWVIAGRDNLWGGPGLYHRSIEIESGYEEIVPSGRGLSVNFDDDGTGAFTLSDILEYFALLRKMVQSEPPLPEVTEEDAKRILGVTQGVPQAVKIVAGLYLEKVNLETITENMGEKRQIVDDLVRRYLSHTSADQRERAKLYGLAMLRRAEQGYAVEAALDLTPEQAKTDYTMELSLLHRRYSFIFTQKEEPSLHQEVRYFLRQWILEHCTDSEIVAVNERLKKAHETALTQLEERRRYSTLKDRLQDDAWVGMYLDLTEQQFWFDPDDGVRYAVPFMIAASIYRRDINAGVAEIGKFFYTEIGAPYRDWWDRATEKLISLSVYVDIFGLGGESGEEMFLDLIDRGRLDFSSPLPTSREELRGVLCWRLGETYQYNDDKSLDWYEKALDLLKHENDIKEATAEMYFKVADRLDDALHGRPNVQIFGGMRISTQAPIRYANPHEKGITLLNRAIELKPKYAVAYSKRGMFYSYQKDYERAFQDCKKAIELNPRDAKVYANQGETYYTLGDYEQAIQNYTRAIELDSQDPYFYQDRGGAYYAQKEYTQAIADYSEAIRIDPQDPNYYLNRGNAYLAQKDYEKAIADYNQAIKLDPRFASAYHNLGVVSFYQQNYDQAIKDYSKAIELDSQFITAYRSRGNVYLEQNNYEQAIKDYNKAIELGPQFASTYFKRGNAYLEQNNYEQAIADYSKAIELDPKYLGAHYYRGSAYGALKEYEKAIQDYNRAIELDPQYVNAYYNRGNTHFNQKEYEKAIKDYTTATELNPQFVVAYLDRGNVYFAQQEYEKALEDFNEVIKRDPQNVDAYNNRGNVYAALKQYEKALEDYEQAITLDPENSTSYAYRGMACLRLKNVQQAYADFCQWYTLDPTAMNASWMAEWIVTCRQRPDTETVERLEKIAAIDTQNYLAYVCRGVALGLSGKLKGGLAELEQAILLEPQEPDAYFWKGIFSAYFYKGRYQKAIEAIEKALEMDLPPVLLEPLYWFEKDRQDFFEQYAKLLLEKYER